MIAFTIFIVIALLSFIIGMVCVMYEAPLSYILASLSTAMLFLILLIVTGGQLNADKWYKLVPITDYQLNRGTSDSDLGLTMNIRLQDLPNEYSNYSSVAINNIRDITLLSSNKNTITVWLNHQIYNSGIETARIWIRTENGGKIMWYQLN